MTETPVVPYQKHIFVCVGEKCAQAGEGLGLYDKLKLRIKELGLEQGSQRICRSKTTCLGVCQGGPVGVVYPEGIWYGKLNEEKIERILQSHLIQGRPVEEWVIHHLRQSPESA